MDSNSSDGFTLDSLTPAELSDRRIFVVIYRDVLSEEAKSAYREYSEELTGQHVATSESPPIYENWPELPEDAQLIDIYYGPLGGTKCHGVYTRVDEVSFRYENGQEGLLVICRKENLIMERRFGRKEESQFDRKLKPHMCEIWGSESAVGNEDGKYMPLENIVDICG